MRSLLIALALLPAAAIAEEFTFSPDAILTCLLGAEHLKTREACIGAASNACMAENDGGATNYGMSTCLRAEYDYWDARLNESYQTVLVRSEGIDAQVRESEVEVPSLAETLTTMQRAWIPFRDAACEYHAAQWTNGSGARPAHVACLMRMTAEQTLLIEGKIY